MDNFLQEQKKAVIARYAAGLPIVKKPKEFYCPDTFTTSNLDDSILPLPSTLTISLLCPISLDRQTVPVRTECCQHVQTFDLESTINSMSLRDFLKKGLAKVHINKSRPAVIDGVDAVFCCPICRQSAALYVDEVLFMALDSLPVHVCSVTVSETGLVTPVSVPTKTQFTVDLENFASQQDQAVNLLSPLAALPTVRVDHCSNDPLTSTSKTFSFNNLGKPWTIPGQRKRDRSPVTHSLGTDGSSFSSTLARRGSIGERCKDGLDTIGVGRRYRRLSTVDLTVDSPC